MSKELSKRDYIATQVLNGIHSNSTMWKAMRQDFPNLKRNGNDTLQDYVAQECYKMADAMLKESNLNQQDNE